MRITSAANRAYSIKSLSICFEVIIRPHKFSIFIGNKEKQIKHRSEIARMINGKNTTEFVNIRLFFFFFKGPSLGNDLPCSSASTS